MQGTNAPPNYGSQRPPQQGMPQFSGITQNQPPNASAFVGGAYGGTPAPNVGTPTGQGRMQWNLPPSMQQYGASAGGAAPPPPGGGPPPGGPAQAYAYQNLLPIRGQGRGPRGQAMGQYLQQYGSGYDPEGMLARVTALRNKGGVRVR